MTELKAKLQDLKWKLEDKWDAFMADPLRSHGAAALGGMFIGLLMGAI